MKCRSWQAGFTLLELMVVLVLIGVASAYVGPQLWKTYTKNQELSIVQDFANTLHQLRLISRTEGHSIHLPIIKHSLYLMKVPLPLSLPTGWEVASSSALVFLPTGVTNGGVVKIRSDSGRLWTLHIDALDGRMKIEEQ